MDILSSMQTFNTSFKVDFWYIYVPRLFFLFFLWLSQFTPCGHSSTDVRHLLKQLTYPSAKYVSGIVLIPRMFSVSCSLLSDCLVAEKWLIRHWHGDAYKVLNNYFENCIYIKGQWSIIWIFNYFILFTFILYSVFQRC